ncbi:MAG: molybdate ABC transporter substrate-binding protein [Myxococcales bacterium]|nr:molybdate ABC transporter substrate-binding protein [Myxococcales bacterium]
MALVLAGCGAPKPPELVVYAASSLTDAFQALGPAFEAAHPGARVTFAFAGSQTLRLQLEQGAPADVFASADARHLDALGPRLTGRHALAQNALVVVTPLDDPAGIATFADLPRARRLVVGAAEVPVGRYTAALLDRAAAQLGPAFRAGVEAAVASREANVRLVRAKVELGEADAAILYRSDVTPRLRVVPIPPALAAPTRLEQARLRDAPHPALADAWLAFTTTPAARAILARHGLGAP